MRLAALLLCLATPAGAVTHGFCWRGAEGYRIEGYISYAGEDATRILTEGDLLGFGVTGWRHDAFLGRWSMKELTPETSWLLRFDPVALEFPMGGSPEEGSYQMWNANGFANDCGRPGFGFNGGNRAQDVCVDGVFVEESGIDPATPLAVATDPRDPCGPVPVAGRPAPARRVG